MENLRAAAPHTIVQLDSNWSFRQIDGPQKSEWKAVAKVPTNVHIDLMNSGMYVEGDHDGCFEEACWPIH